MAKKEKYSKELYKAFWMNVLITTIIIVILEIIFMNDFKIEIYELVINLMIVTFVSIIYWLVLYLIKPLRNLILKYRKTSHILGTYYLFGFMLGLFVSALSSGWGGQGLSWIEIITYPLTLPFRFFF